MQDKVHFFSFVTVKKCSLGGSLLAYFSENRCQSPFLSVNSAQEGKRIPCPSPHKSTHSLSISTAPPSNTMSPLLSQFLIILMYCEVAAAIAGSLASLIKDSCSSFYPQFGTLTAILRQQQMSLWTFCYV